MDLNLNVVVCPSCGATVKPENDKCEFCGNNFSFVLKTGNYFLHKDIETLLSNQLYEQAEESLSNFPVDSQTYVYQAIIALDGKPAFVHQRADIDKIIKKLDMALAISHNADAAFVRSYIEYDYFERKCLNRRNGYSYYLNLSQKYGITDERKHFLEKMFNNIYKIN